MQRHNRKRHVAVIGQSSSGKTTLAARLLCNSRFDYNFIFDEEEQFSDILKIPVCRTPEEIGRAIQTGWILYCSDEMFPGEPEQGCEFFADFVFQVCGRLPGKKYFVLDEAGMFQESYSLPRPLKIICQKGRRHGIDGLFLFQQPSEMHTKLRNQISEVICFQALEDSSSGFLKKIRFQHRRITEFAAVSIYPPHARPQRISRLVSFLRGVFPSPEFD